MVTTNDGAGWQERDLAANLPAGTNSVSIIAVDPTNAGTLLLRVRRTLSGDGGSETDEAVSLATNGGLSIATPLMFPGGLVSAYARTADGEIVISGVVGVANVAYRSTDGGGSFAQLPNPQPTVRALSARGQTLYAAGDDEADG
jgi:hypothetical protein